MTHKIYTLVFALMELDTPTMQGISCMGNGTSGGWRGHLIDGSERTLNDA